MLALDIPTELFGEKGEGQMKNPRMMVRKAVLISAIALAIAGVGAGAASAQQPDDDKMVCYDVVDGEMYRTPCNPPADLGPDD
jgi:hypothetical protein